MAEVRHPANPSKTPPRERKPHPGKTKRRTPWDLLGAAAAVVLAALMSTVGGGFTIWLTLLILTFAPGYLLIQSIRPRPNAWHLAIGAGLSIPIIGLFALAAALIPGGFYAGAIVAATTTGTLLLAALAFRRRMTAPYAVAS